SRSPSESAPNDAGREASQIRPYRGRRAGRLIRESRMRGRGQRPPPPPPPPPPPENPPPPEPELLPGGVDADAIDAVRPAPTAFAMPPRLPERPPWYHAMRAVASAAAAAPTAAVNLSVQASSTSRATA